MPSPSIEELVNEIIRLKYDLGIKYDKELSEMMGWGRTRVSNLLNVELLKKDALELRDKMLELKEKS